MSGADDSDVLPRALLITGAVGVGKTTTAHAIGDELRARAIPGAVIDLDQLRLAWPAPEGDRFHCALERQNLAALAANYRAAGARVLVAAGVIEDRAVREEYRAALGSPLTVVRLTVPRDLVRSRLRRRHERDPAGLAWHLDRYDELTAILDAASVEDIAVAGGVDPGSTARAVLAAVEI